MDIAVRARNVEVSDSLRRVTLEKVTRLGSRCGIDRADVCFSEERNPRITEREVCEIALFGPGRILRAQAAATEATVAVDRVMGQLVQRADRLRGRLLGRRGRRACPLFVRVPWLADGSLHFPANWSAAEVDPVAVDRVMCDAGEAAGMGISDSNTEPMTPEEAALAMGEQGSDIFLFVNAETGGIAVVYRRADGNIALAGPPVPASASCPTPPTPPPLTPVRS